MRSINSALAAADVARYALHRSVRKSFMECTPEQRKEILDLIAFRKNAKKIQGESGRGVLRIPQKLDLRRLLHQQNRHQDLQYIAM